MDSRGLFSSRRNSTWRGFCRSLSEIKLISVCMIFSTFVEELLFQLTFASFLCYFCFRKNKDLVEQLSNPHRETKDLHFPSKYSRSFFAQLLACLWKQNLSYWRNPQYTAVRFFYTVIISLMFGTICWRFGSKRYHT